MLDKNHPLSAFLFDLLGVLVILGVVLIIARKYVLGSEDKLKGLPRTGRNTIQIIKIQMTKTSIKNASI